jgi:hypothetical protein
VEAAAVLLRRARAPDVAKLEIAPYDDEELNEEGLSDPRGPDRARRRVV